MVGTHQESDRSLAPIEQNARHGTEKALFSWSMSQRYPEFHEGTSIDISESKPLASRIHIRGDDANDRDHTSLPEETAIIE